MNYFGRTDLALEEREAVVSRGITPSKGVIDNSHDAKGFHITSIKITNDDGVKLLNKPIGTYITIELDKYIKREDNSFADGAEVFSSELRGILKLDSDNNILVVGLGNSAITPDALGHCALKYTLATRHLKAQFGEEFSFFRSVSLLEPGVLGTTGIESFDIIRSVIDTVKPSIVIAIDALASRSVQRICRTIQLSDVGIIPGSGIGNSRAELSLNTIGIPVIAVGVPTVVDAASIAYELACQSGYELDESILRSHEGSMIVTPKDIDANISDMSRLIGYGIDLALHDGLSVSDIDMFVG